MIEGLVGRTVAVIGKAPSLWGAGHGEEIESFDTIVRVNTKLPLSTFPADAGLRTDVIYCCYDFPWRREAETYRGVRVCIVDWRLRLAIARRSYVRDCQPTTGLVAIVDALSSGASKVKVFGFDLYANGLGTGPPHDPEEDRAYLRRLMETEPRFRGDDALNQAVRLVPI